MVQSDTLEGQTRDSVVMALRDVDREVLIEQIDDTIHQCDDPEGEYWLRTVLQRLVAEAEQ